MELDIYDFYITPAGENLLLNQQSGGPSVELIKIAIDDHSYDPSAIVNQTVLINEVDRVDIQSFKRVDNTLQMASVIDNDKEYEIGGLALIAKPNILFAVHSRHKRKLGYKASAGRFIPRFGMAIDTLPNDSITVCLQGDNFNLIVTPELAMMTLSQVRMNSMNNRVLRKKLYKIIDGE